ncbi:MAG: hypothetical protein ABSH32_15795 [Bryobacteraceae bacterium]|jgi:hypothetical protein
MRSKSQQREFATLIVAFESLTRPPDETREFADLIDCFQETD